MHDSSLKIKTDTQTYSSNSSITRKKGTLGKCIDVVFRECGACIHSFSLTPAKCINQGAIGKSLPVFANVHPLDPTIEDPRIPSKPVPGIVKWVNDKIESIENLSNRITNAPVKKIISENFNGHTQVIKKNQAKLLNKKMQQAYWRDLDKKIQIKTDEWIDEHEEKKALINLLDIITIVSICGKFEDPDNSHCRITLNDFTFNLISTLGNDHVECLSYINQICNFSCREEVVLVTCTKDHHDISDRDNKFTGVNNIDEENTERRFTDPNKVTHISHNSVVSLYQNKQSVEEIKEGLHELFRSRT